jgi:hypothetical protein
VGVNDLHALGELEEGDERNFPVRHTDEPSPMKKGNRESNLPRNKAMNFGGDKSPKNAG